MAFPPSLWPQRLTDQNFGMCITPNDFIIPFYNAYGTNYYRPWKWCTQESISKDFGSTIDNDKDQFKVTLDVQHFRPNEINVKVINNDILIEGKHEERKDDHGFVARQFTRRYTLPSYCLPEDVVSSLSSDGVLTVTACKKSAKDLKTYEKVIPIKLCETCPIKQTEKVKEDKDKKETSCGKIKLDDISDKKNTQVMLKEDHCCLLLKPELLKDAVSDNTEKICEKKKNIEDEKSKTTMNMSQTEKSTTSEMIEQTLGMSGSAMATAGEVLAQSSKASAGMSESMSMSSKTMESVESTSSSSYKSSLSLNMKSTSETLSEFDMLCSELDNIEVVKK